MAEDGGSKLFPAVFYDGIREMNIGHVNIYPSLDLKTFQSILSQKIGISANHMSIYVVDKKKPKLSHEDRRKILITGRVSFARIVKEKECFILVVLKRSRREKRRKAKQNNVEIDDNRFSREPEMFLLRRNQLEFDNKQFYNEMVEAELESVRDRLRNLQIQRENYMAAVLNSSYLDCFPKIGGDGYGVYEAHESAALDLCEGCRDREGDDAASFHWCANDVVTVGFRSSVGPIARPAISTFASYN